MEKYSLNKYLGLITQGELRSAVDYLRQFPNKKRLVRKYVQIFDENENKPVSKNKKVQLICSIFQEYYKLIFW